MATEYQIHVNYELYDSTVKKTKLVPIKRIINLPLSKLNASVPLNDLAEKWLILYLFPPTCNMTNNKNRAVPHIPSSEKRHRQNKQLQEGKSLRQVAKCLDDNKSKTSLKKWTCAYFKLHRPCSFLFKFVKCWQFFRVWIRKETI